jgi:hypothetical protein
VQEFFGAFTVSQKTLPNEQVLDWEGLVGRLRSSSYAPQEGHPNYAPMLADLEQLFRANEKDGRLANQS